MKILITGTAGFIGFHLVNRLINDNVNIIGIDNINDYYDVNLKYNRLANHGILKSSIDYNKKSQSVLHKNYAFIKMDISDTELLLKLMDEEKFDVVINLAAQAGVRYSIQNPRVYTKSNIEGFLNVLEGCRYNNVKHLIYASTSSVYGLNKSMPLQEDQNTDHQMAYYAVTKKANELMAHSYSHLFGIPTSGLRFFTVYGPWGRPDMALFLFADAIINNKPIKVFNHGKMIRDFTYVGDIVESIYKLISLPPTYNENWDSISPNSSNSSAPYQVFNIGNSNPVKLLDYIEALENAIGKKSIKELLPIQDGDVPETNADVSKLQNYIDFKPNTDINIGIEKFVRWYIDYHKLKI